jgi:hypothetical protein
MTENNNFVHFIILKKWGKIYIYTGKLKIVKFYVIDFSHDLNMKSDRIYFAFYY